MAAFKLYFLALLACSALMETESASIERNVIDDLEKLVEFEKIVHDTIEKYVHALQEVVVTITETINNDLNEAFNEVQKVVQEVTKTTEALYQEAKQHGKDLKNCASVQVPKIQQLVQETEMTQAACVEESAKEIAIINERLSVKLESLREEVALIIANIQACKNVDCMREFGKKLSETVAAVKENVQLAIQEAVKVVKDTSPEAVRCIVDASDNFKSEMKKVLVEVKECVSKA